MFFVRNGSTRYISPTKTPEYLAAGKPVVSTSITDVITPYADHDLVRIADAVPDFVRACEAALTEPPAPRRIRANVFLRGMSWDRTWAKTASILHAVLENPVQTAQLSVPSAGLSLGA